MGRRLNFLHSGAGIGGLVLAITIGRFAGRDIHLDLYEAHDAITATGAGISVPQRTAEVMVELGLYEKISRVSSKPSSSSLGLFRTCVVTAFNSIRFDRSENEEV
jgi:salicylate hydroxylase